MTTYRWHNTDTAAWDDLPALHDTLVADGVLVPVTIDPEHQHQWLPWLTLMNGSSWTQCTGCGEQFQYDCPCRGGRTMTLPDGISMCARYGGYHAYMAGPCFDRKEQAIDYKAKLDRHGIK